MLLLAIHVSSLEKYLSSLLPYLNWVVLSLGLLGSSVGKESTCNAGASGSIPGSGRSLGEGIGYPLQYSWASLMVREDGKESWAQMVKNPPAMRDLIDPWVGKILWRIPWTVQSMGLQRAGHD